MGKNLMSKLEVMLLSGVISSYVSKKILTWLNELSATEMLPILFQEKICQFIN